MTKARTNADNVAGDISGVTAGTGLTGGGTSGTVTLTNDMATTINAAGDLIYGTGNDAYTRLALGTARQTLLTNAGATAPEWAASPQSLMTATGDILYASSANTPARLGIGTASQYLAVNSGATAPEWVTLNAGGMTLISRQTPSASTGFSFSSIPGTYKQLLLVWHGLYTSNTSTAFALRLNNVAGNYQVFYYYFNSGSSTDVTGGFAGTTTVSGTLPLLNGNSTQNNDNVSSGRLIIYDYASTTKDKKYFYDNRLNDGNQKMEYANGVFGENGAITSIDIVRTASTGTVSTLTDGYIDLFGVN